MTEPQENNPETKPRELLSDEELPSYQLPRDDSISEEDDLPACFRVPRLRSSVRAVSLPFYDEVSFVEEKNAGSCSAPDVLQKSSFKALGMSDKDISWASSMESIVEECSPRNDFNTIEKATFFPDPDAIQSKQIQPRALFPRESDESLGLKPLDSSLNSEDIPPYSRAMRLSDVCDVLQSLNVVTRTPYSSDKPENLFDFMDKGPNSPSVFSQKSEDKDLFDDAGPKSDPCPSDKIERTTPTNPPSPSVFSPDTKQRKIPSPLKRLSPIAENSKTCEDSALEIVLDESLPNCFSTPFKKLSPAKPVCPDVLKDIKLTGVIVPEVSKPAVKVKKLYGAVTEVKPVQEIDDEILQSLTASEQTSCQFLDKRPEKSKALPESKGLIPFTQLLGNDTETKSLKRAGEELPNCDGKKKKTSDIEERKIQTESTWNSALLSDSQADLLDMAADLVEKSLDFNVTNKTFCDSMIRNNHLKEEPPFMGFKSGSNKFMKPSTAALARVGNLFDDCLDETLMEPGGFKVLGKKSIGPSSAASSLFLNSSNHEQSITPKSAGFTGFKTGNARVIQTAVSLSKIHKVFDGCDVPVLYGDLKTGNNKFALPSSLSTPKNIFEDDVAAPGSREKKLQESSLGEKSFIGFQTGNAKPVKPNSATLSRIKNLFDGCDFPIDEMKPTLTAECKSLHRVEDGGKNGNRSLTGFSTARNNSIKLNKGSLTKVRDLFKDETEDPVQIASVMEESYSTLVENTDWDADAFLPAVEQLSPAETVSIRPAVKRQSSPTWESSKRQKITEELTGFQIVLKKRKVAWEAQARIIEEKKGTERSMRGSHFLKKEIAKQTTWKEFLPLGPKIYELEQLRELGVLESVINVSIDNAKDFRFSAKDYFSSTFYENNTTGLTIGDGFSVILDEDNSFGAREIEQAFLAGPGVAPELLPSGWVIHHYGLVVWKLACYERSCAEKLAGSALNPDSVMFQLKYRYDREIDRCQSSALKRVLERDDAAGKALVLTVLRITKLVEGSELLLTDGWYTCPARTDCALNNAIKSGKIQVGTKIMTIGAELIGCEQGIPPLERPDTVYLKLATNSTRRVHWYRKMGFANLPFTPSIRLCSILPGGGNIACTRVLVVRVYPVLFVEKTSDGKNVTRNGRAEQKEAMAFQANLETKMAKLYDQIERDTCNKTRNGFSSSMRISEIDSPEKLYSILESAEDPGSIEASMTEEQRSAVLQYKEARHVQRNRLLEDRMKELKVSTRNVRTVLRVRLVDLEDSENTDNSAVLSWWQPDEELTSIFTEGSSLSLFNVAPGSGKSQQTMYLNSSRQTRIETLHVRKNVSRTVLRPGDIRSDFSPCWGELDVVGLVVQVQGINEGTSLMQTVYLADTEQNFFGLIFWRGLKEFCCDDILAEGLVVGVTNVQWRRSSANAKIPCGFITETTQFTLNSKSDQMQSAISSLKEELEEEDIAGLIERSQDAITTRLHSVTNQSNISVSISCNSNAGALDNSNLETSEAEVSSSPRPRYLNGFTQNPRAASTPVKSRPPVHWRVDKLQQIGEPPPLSPIPIPATAKASRAFKLPTIQENSSADSR